MTTNEQQARLTVSTNTGNEWRTAWTETSDDEMSAVRDWLGGIGSTDSLKIELADGGTAYFVVRNIDAVVLDVSTRRSGIVGGATDPRQETS